MTRRERFLAALSRRQPDRIPLDLGSTFASTVNRRAYGALRAHLGLPPHACPAVLLERSQTVIPAEDLVRRLGVDARPVLLGAPDGRPDRRISEDAFTDEWGVTWTRPADGHYIPSGGPFYGLDEPSVRQIGSYNWPDAGDPGRYRGLRERARQVHAAGYAVVLSLGVGPIHLCQFMRGYAGWLEDLLVAPAFAQALLERITDFWEEVAERALGEAGEYVDVVALYDDLGTQRGPLVRPELYRRAIKPCHARLAAVIKRQGKALVWHACGSVYRLLPDLIEIGVDALNPVQVSAAEMDTARLKREFGKDLAFWGGVDTGRVLPRGTPEEVRAEVARRVADLGPGGYILCAVHNIQADVPPANVAAMYEAALSYSG